MPDQILEDRNLTVEPRLRDAVENYLAWGLRLCRIPAGAKRPVERGWVLGSLVSAAQLRPGDAVGMVIGAEPACLMPVDLDFHSDDKEAWEAADELLPATELIDGRSGKPKAHRYYQLVDEEWPDGILPRPGSETRKAMDAGNLPRFPGTRHFSNGHGRTIDFLGAGSQIVIPPSRHRESGTHREWFWGEPGQPARVMYDELLAAVLALAHRLGMEIRQEPDAEKASAAMADDELDAVPVERRLGRLTAYLDQSAPLAHGLNQGFHAQQWRIACTCAELGVPFDDALPLYLAWNRQSTTPDDDAINQATLANAYQATPFGVRAGEERGVDLTGLLPMFQGEPATTTALSVPAPPDRQLAMTWFADTPERKPDWLWPDHLLKGTTAVLGGKQGSSKGLFTVDIAARLTRGDSFPDGSGGGDPTRVLIVTREDDPEMALKPRLRVAGADMQHIAWTHGDFTDETPIPTMAAAAAYIAQQVTEHDIGLVIIDPLGAWVEDDANNGQQIRAVIDPMNRMARETGCAVLFVAHLRKAAAEDPMDAFAGSVQVTAACRTAMLLTTTADGGERMVQVVKTNFRPPATPLIYQLKKVTPDPDDPPALAWRPVTVEDLAVEAARTQGGAPVVPVATALEFVTPEHRPLKTLAKTIKRQLIPTMRKVSIQAVVDALEEAIAAELAYEGRGAHGERTIGLEAAAPPETATDKTIRYWEEHPEATVREVAEAVGCSRSVAGRARTLVK